MAEGFAITPLTHSVESSQALRAANSTLLACADVRELSTTAADCLIRAVEQPGETTEVFGLSESDWTVKNTQAAKIKNTNGNILFRILYGTTKSCPVSYHNLTTLLRTFIVVLKTIGTAVGAKPLATKTPEEVKPSMWPPKLFAAEDGQFKA